MKRNKMTQKRTLGWLIIFSILLMMTLFGLTSCSGAVTKYSTVIVQPPKVYVTTKTDLIRKLGDIGIPVIEASNQTTVVLSNDRLFKNGSIKIRQKSQYIFPILGHLMRHYQKVRMSVLVYSDNPDRHLVKARAQQIATTLWQQGIDTRLLYTRIYNKPSPWTCDNIMRCTIIQYHYFPQMKDYD